MDAHEEQGISPLTLFYSYADANEDEKLREKLETHLSVLQRQGKIAGWHRHKIMPGANKNQVSEEQLSSAQIILLLITPDFLALDTSYTEMERALQRHEDGLAHVIPLLLRPVDWESAPFAHLQALPRDGKPVTTWKNLDLAFVDIAKGIRSAIEQWNASSSHSLHQLPQSTISVPPSFLFLSSARKDLPLVNRLKDDLQAHDITGWVDHKAVPDEEDLREAIRNASAVILVASVHTRRSRLVKQELQIAEMYQRPIYLFWMQGNDLREVAPTGWSLLPSFDARAERYSQALQDLLQAFGNQTSPSPSSSVRKEDDTNASRYPGKYTIQSDGPMQGQVIGEHVYVTMNFAHGQQEDEPSQQQSCPPSDHAPSSQDHLLKQPVLSLEAPRNPYKGLQAFHAEDAQDFFGRDHLVKELLEKVQQLLTMDQQNKAASRLLTVLGPSGSGKSSVVMAGLLPKLKQGALPDSQYWIYLDSIVPGEDPIEALTLILSSLFPERGLKSIREDLEDDSARGLHMLLKAHVRQSDKHVILVIDQFEELFTQTATEEQRQFLDLLLAATSEPHGPLVALLTLRADFYDRPLQYPELGRLIKNHQVIVFPMEMPDLRRVIEQPAQLPDVQLTFQEDLVGDLLFDMQGQVGALPLLQFTLDQLFQQRQGRLLTRQVYQKLGGVKGALAKHAESTYQSLPTEAHQWLTRALFLRLINPGTVEEDATKRRIPLSELIVIDSEETARLAKVTHAFMEVRLLTANMIGKVSTVEVSHEALIRAWDRLEDWLHEARDDIHLQQAISQDAAEWQRHGQPTDRLYRGSQLTEALEWRKANLPSLDEDRFLQASIEELHRTQQEERQQRRRYTRRMVVIGLAGIAGMAGTGLLVTMLRGNASPPSKILLPPKILPYAYTGHSNTVYSVAWSPDGKRIASGSADETVQVWDASTGSRLLTYKGHTNYVGSVAWSPDGKHIASGSADETVQVWDASTGSRLLTYKGHTGTVYSVAWSPDGKHIASASNDETVQVWNASTGSRLLTYKGHTNYVGSVAWSPDGKHIASGSADETVQVWDASTGSRLLTYSGHIDNVVSVAWSPDGKHIASASNDETVQVWDASTGSLLLTYKGHLDTVVSVAWSPDGKWIVSGSVDKTVQVWDASTGSRLLIYSGHSNTVWSVAWSPDGKRIASGSQDETVQVWNVSSSSLLIYSGHSNTVWSVAWSPDGKWIASGSADETVQVWDASTGSRLLAYSGHGNTVVSVAWSPDGNRIASGSADKTVQVWDASTGSRLLTYKGHTNYVGSVAWSPDGKRIASASDDETVQVWDASTGSRLLTYKDHTDAVRSVAWSPDGKRIASGSLDETTQVWDANTGSRLLTYSGHGSSESVAWSPDGKRIASGSFDATVQVWDASTGSRLLAYSGHTNTVISVAWSSDGKYIASGSLDETAQVWAASTGSPLLTYKGHSNYVESVAWSPDGKRIVSGSQDETAQVWDANNSSLLTYKGHTNAVWSVAWSPNGKRIASGSNDKTAQVWDASTGRLLFTYKGHTNYVESVVWSPDGKRIASSSKDETVQLWDASTGRRLLTYKGHTNAVYGVAWSPDGKRIASSSKDETVQLWDASTGRLLLTYKGHGNTVWRVAWSPDGKYIASGSLDETVQVWNASTGRLLLTYSGHTNYVVSVAWSPDGKQIASGSLDETVQIWNVSNGSLLLTYIGHINAVWSVAWSSDGKRVASGSSDETAQVWDASSGRLLFTYNGHTNAVYSVTWSSDGMRITSGSADKTVQVWDAPGD